jgi:taurine dioxygenase
MAVGAEVCGLGAVSEIDAASREQLYGAWLTHGFLLFRGVETIEQHLAISRCFGELEVHPVPETHYQGNPHLVEIGTPHTEGRERPAAFVFDGDIRLNRLSWHRDTAFTPDICKGAMLRMLEAPAHHGETMLADTAMAWDDLPEELCAELERLEYKATIRTDPMNTLGRAGTFWSSARQATVAEDPAGGGRLPKYSGIENRYPSVIHPAVLAHPESGRKCLFLSPTYIDLFLGMTQAASDRLLRRLTEHMLQPKYVYRHQWAVDDAIIWDNRRMLHAGAGNRPDEPRYGLRTTLAGPLRTGRYFDAAAEQAELDGVD